MQQMRGFLAHHYHHHQLQQYIDQLLLYMLVPLMVLEHLSNLI